MSFTLNTVLFFLSFLSASVVHWLSPTTYDVGRIERHQAVEIAFSYKNVTTAPLIIDNIRTTCGCTAPEWDKAPLLPDSVGVIRVVYDAAKSGHFRKRIQVFFNSQRRGEILYIEGEVR